MTPAATRAVSGDQPRQGRISRLREYRNPAGTMLAFFSVELPSGLVIHGLKLMVGPKGRRFVGMPDTKRRDANDRPVLDANGKPTYDLIVDFAPPSRRAKFNDAVLAALRAHHPELFHGEPTP